MVAGFEFQRRQNLLGSGGRLTQGTCPHLQVPTGAEMTVCTMEDRHYRFGIRVERNKCLIQRTRGLRVHGVAYIGPVQGDQRHRAELADIDCLNHAVD